MSDAIQDEICDDSQHLLTPFTVILKQREHFLLNWIESAHCVLCVVLFNIYKYVWFSSVFAVLKPPHHQSSPGKIGLLGSAILARRTFAKRWKRKNMPWSCSTPRVRKPIDTKHVISRVTQSHTAPCRVCEVHQSFKDTRILHYVQKQAVLHLRYQGPVNQLHSWVNLTPKHAWTDQRSLHYLSCFLLSLRVCFSKYISTKQVYWIMWKHKT